MSRAPTRQPFVAENVLFGCALSEVHRSSRTGFMLRTPIHPVGCRSRARLSLPFLLPAFAITLCACTVANNDDLDADDPQPDQVLAMHTAQLLAASPASATPVPADYDGDKITDMALKGPNGIWYLDVGHNGFGGAWDFAYPGYGDATAVPTPADFDGDGRADLAVKDAGGRWGIDYANNFFGVWDSELQGYGGSAAVPAVADYDGDCNAAGHCRADLAVRTSTGEWLIDYSANGFGTWDARFTDTTGPSSIPVPADYDGDRHADRALKDINGTFHIDYWRNGFGRWDEVRRGYGGTTAIPVPADYDGDGSTDLAVKDQSGTWFVDYASGGFGMWNASYASRGGDWSMAVPGDYDGDGKLDLSIKDTSGFWCIDYASKGYGAWDVAIDNVKRMLVNEAEPWISATDIYDQNGKVQPVNGQFPLTIGVRYTVAVRVETGTVHYKAGLEVNPALHVPASLRLVNPVGTTGHALITADHTRRFGLTCSEPGSYPLGFMMRDITNVAFNPDYGIRVSCTSPKPGIYGVVTARQRLSNGRYIAGPGLADVTVSLGRLTTLTDKDGNWSLPSVIGGPHRVTLSKFGYSDAIAINVTIPSGSGVKVDAALEEPFTKLRAAGLRYTTYIDYSRGRSILHTVRIDPRYTNVRLEKSSSVDVSSPITWKTLLQHASEGDREGTALVLINGGYFNVNKEDDVPEGDSEGYFYVRGFLPSVPLRDYADHYAEPMPNVLQPAFVLPMFTITGLSTGQQFSIVHTEADFRSPTSSQWSQGRFPIYDVAPRDGRSDVTYALQATPTLLMNDQVIARDTINSHGAPAMAWARTTVGIGPDSLYLVVADGEGVNGGQGATFHQLGEFYRDELHATTALNFDGGLSTDMVLRGANGARPVNTLTGEDSSWDINPAVEAIARSAGGPGSVSNYLAVGQ